MEKIEITTALHEASKANELIDNSSFKMLDLKLGQYLTKIDNIKNIQDYDQMTKDVREYKKLTNDLIKSEIKPIKKALKFLKDDFVGKIEKELLSQVELLESNLEQEAIVKGLLILQEATPNPKTKKVACCGNCGSENIIYKLIEVE